MNISLQKVGNVKAEITVSLVKADYEENVKKTLKNFCQKAQMPGFRPGKVPMGMVKKMYGTQAKADEVNKLLGESLMNYIRENNVNMLGEPMASEKQVAQDIETQEDFEFIFDVALAPEFTVECSAADKVAYYDIQVSEEQVEEQVKQLAQRGGHTENVETYSDRDIVRGVLAELDETGMPKEGGLQVEMASLMPAYFKNEEQKALFATAKTNDVITFCPAKAYEGSDAELAALLKIKKEETAQYQGNFSFQVNEISHFVAAELNQEFFDNAVGKDKAHNEEEYRAALKEMIEKQLASDSNYRFSIDAKEAIQKAVGDIELPDAVLKEFLMQQDENLNEENIETEYQRIRPDLVWQLTREAIAKQLELKVEEQDILAVARMLAQSQFAQYGMTNLPDDVLDKYGRDILNDPKSREHVVNQAVDMKLYYAIRENVTIDNKTVSVQQFNELFAPAEA
jgi:trigger factor